MVLKVKSINLVGLVHTSSFEKLASETAFPKHSFKMSSVL